MPHSIIKFSKTKIHPDFRIDAEYFEPQYLDLENYLSQRRTDPLVDYADFIKKGIFDISPENYTLDGGIPFLRSGDLKDELIQKDDIIYISEQSHQTERKTELNKNDLLLSKVGTIGDVALNLCFEKINFSQNVIGVKIKKKFKVISGFLLSYLNSKYGRKQIDRVLSGQVQQKLTLEDIKSLRVVLLSDNFQNKISNLVFASFRASQSSKDYYKQVEHIFLSDLGLLNWKPKHQLSFIKNFSDTQTADRINAEYFQPMYDEIIEKFKKHSQCEILRDITKLIGHPSNPPYADEDSKKKTFIITQKHLGSYFPSDNFWEDAEALYTSDEFIKKNKQYILQTNDIILYSVGAYIGKANIYNSDINATIGSFLTLIRPDQEKINPYYLLVFLNSEFGKHLTRRFSRGMAQQYVYPFDIREFVIPLISKIEQEEIERKMLDALNAKAKSKHLLNIAKRAVEMAIEKDEQTAMKWIEKQVEGVN